MSADVSISALLKSRPAGLGAPELPALSRRGFLIGAAAGAGVTAAFVSASQKVRAAEEAIAAGAFEPTIWYSIDAEGIVTVNIAEAEMGQHVGTSLARIVAEELEANWDDVRINLVDSDPKWGLMVTGGSWSVWQNFPILSQAGAAGRTALIEAAAVLLDVAPEDCTAANSTVSGGGQTLTYAEIIQRGDVSKVFTADELAGMPVKPASARTLVGRETQAIDVPAKTDGTTVYGIDAEIEGMVYARPLLPPTRHGSSINSIDDSAARDVPGYLQTIALEDPSGTVPGWAVVIAESFPAALAASQRVVVDWTPGDTAEVSEDDLLEAGRQQIADATAGGLVVNDDGVDAAFESAERVFEADYTTSTVLHFQLEPVNATAFQTDDGRWEIHTGNQWQSLVLPWLAQALEVPESDIVMRTYSIGGGFGRRLNGDYAVPAALASKALGRPVKLVLTREDDSRFDSVRSPSVQRVRMAFDAESNPVGMEHHAAAGWPTQAMAPFFMPPGLNGTPYDPFAIQGANHWYDFAHQRLRAVNIPLANQTFRPGWLRSVGAGWVNWALESFLDEAAHSIGADPVEFRLAHLTAQGDNAGSAPYAVGGASRQAAVLQRAAELGGWGASDLPADTGLGIATTYGQERAMPTWTACVARVRVDRDTGRVTCEKLSLAIDCGTVVHPDGAMAQAQGAALWGLSMALHEGARFEAGQVRERNLNAYTPLRMSDVPALEIELMDSTEDPVGMGEPATTVVAPAIGNAIFAAVGARVRDLPIRPEAVLAAMG
ncbi:MAG: molybdopterin-dependent oxidoreductase [Maricaulaceae bacterium]|jgi:CO/xanthine dehydrogenase Mo-binding subunit